MARAEVLQQLASKLETAIIVLEREPIQDEENADADAGAGADAASSNPTNPSSTAPASASPPRARDLDAEFRSLEVNQLERMLRMTPDADDAPDTVSFPTPTAETDARRRERVSPRRGRRPRVVAPTLRKRDNRRFVVVVVIVVVVVVFFLLHLFLSFDVSR